MLLYHITWDSQRPITDLTVDEACHTCLGEIRGIIKHIFHFGGFSQKNLSRPSKLHKASKRTGEDNEMG